MENHRTFFSFLLFFCWMALSASSGNLLSKEVPDAVSYTSNREMQAPLNVVYFVPKDLAGRFDKEKKNVLHKAGEALLYAQHWYEKQMELNGYGEKTFALSTNPAGEVLIVVVYGEKNCNEYSNNKAVKSEVDAFFLKNKSLIKGSHFVVLSDWSSGFRNAANGRMAFHRSSDNYTIKATAKCIDGLQLIHFGTCGGLLHELGHAFNSPHTSHLASDEPVKSIMGGGGAILYNKGGNEEKVVLLPVSAAVLNVSEAFNRTDNGIRYYEEEPTLEMLEYKIEKNNSKHSLVAHFEFTSDILPTHLYVSWDAFPARVNSDYDKVSFLAKVVPAGQANHYTASVEIPYSEYFNKFEDENKVENRIEFSVNVLTENGMRNEMLNYDFTITQIPVPDNNIERTMNAD